MGPMTQVGRPGLLMRAFFQIGERMFGQVPTPERLMAHRASCPGSAASTAPASGWGRWTASFGPC
jgi:hypothetical protein